MNKTLKNQITNKFNFIIELSDKKLNQEELMRVKNILMPTIICASHQVKQINAIRGLPQYTHERREDYRQNGEKYLMELIKKYLEKK